MRILHRITFFVFIFFFLTGCMRWDYGEELSDFDIEGEGLFILCEGNFQYGNSSLHFYDTETNEVFQNVFFNANGMKLGDVAQSITIYDDRCWIVVNNSHVIFAIDTDTFKEKGRVENLTSPRYIHFINDEKAYVSQLWDNRIFIINPRTYSITGHILIPGMQMESGSTEQMVQLGKYVYCTCWSYQNKIIKIDTEADKVVDELIVGIQPRYLVMDKNGKLWTLTDGGLEGSVYGHEPPSLIKIDAKNFVIEKKFEFRIDDLPADLQLDGKGEELYWINGSVWRMSINSEILPSKPFLEFRDTKYYGLTIDPRKGDVYVADAIDYMQPGMIYRFSNSGMPVDEFYVGVTPGAFCWKTH